MVNARNSYGNGRGVMSSRELTDNPNGVQSFSPGLPRQAAATLGGTSQNPTADSEAARSAKFICGYPIRPIRRIRPIPPSHLGREPLIKVKNGLKPPLSLTCHRPKIKPENKGIKPKSNRHIRAVWETARRICPAKAGRRPQGRASGRERVQPKNSLGHCASWLPARTTLASPTILHSRPSFCILRQPLPANAKLCQPPPSPILFSHRVAIRNGGPDAVSHG